MGLLANWVMAVGFYPLLCVEEVMMRASIVLLPWMEHRQIVMHLRQFLVMLERELLKRPIEAIKNIPVC